MTSAIVCGAICSILGTYLMAALCALLFRFPIPFGGYSSGLQAALPSLMAVTMYGVVFGGFVVQGLLGGVAGVLAWWHGGPDRHDRRRTWRLCAVYGLVASLPGVVILAVLDKIIGPW